MVRDARTKDNTRFQALSNRLSRQVKSHGHQNQMFRLPDERVVRNFTMRETADFLKINQNTFRYYISTLSDRLPTGVLIGRNRRYFTLKEIHEIQRILFEEGKICPEVYPRRQGYEPCILMSCLGAKRRFSVSAHAATSLALRGYRLLCCDLDPQAGLTRMFGVTPELRPDMMTAYDLLRHQEPVPARKVIQKTYFPHIDLIPASPSLMKGEYETALSFKRATQNGEFHPGIANALKQVLPHYDVVIFQMPPQLSLMAISALLASQGVLIPVNASMPDVMSLKGLLQKVGSRMEMIETHVPDHSFDFVKFLITDYKPTDRSHLQMASFLRTALGEAVMATEFLKLTVADDEVLTKQTLLEIEPRSMSRKTYEQLIEASSRITAELEAAIAKARGRQGVSSIKVGQL